MKKPLAERFSEKVVVQPNGCHVHTSRQKEDEYGKLWYDGKSRQATHVAWFLAYGYWPKQINHNCDNPRCVRIDHIYEGNQKQNGRDKALRRRDPGIKICAWIADAIRSLYRTGTVTQREIAETTGLSQSQVCYILHGLRWARDQQQAA